MVYGLTHIVSKSYLVKCRKQTLIWFLALQPLRLGVRVFPLLGKVYVIKVITIGLDILMENRI